MLRKKNKKKVLIVLDLTQNFCIRQKQFVHVFLIIENIISCFIIMKHINTILILVILVIVLNQSSGNVIKETVNVPPKRKPLFNYNTQRVEPFTRIGVLYKNDSNDILSLYGRRTHVRSNTWNYYTITNDESKIKIELNIKDRQCLRKTGCKELYNGDTIHIPEYNGLFTVNMYL